MALNYIVQFPVFLLDLLVGFFKWTVYGFFCIEEEYWFCHSGVDKKNNISMPVNDSQIIAFIWRQTKSWEAYFIQWDRWLEKHRVLLKAVRHKHKCV